MWKLDLLETNFLKTKARLPRTNKLLKAKNQRLPLLDLSEEDAKLKIDELKSLLCERKIHASVQKLGRVFKKVVAHTQQTLKNKKSKDSKLENELALLHDLDIDTLAHTRLIKVITKTYNINAKFSDSVPQFLPEWCKTAILNNEDKYSPKHQFKSNSQEMNNFISKISNHKDFKNLVEDIETSLKIVVGPVEKKRKDTKDVEEADSESESEPEESADSEVEDGEEISENEGEVDEDLIVDAYKGLVAASDDEDDQDDQFQLDPNVDYNQVTDEEPSEGSDADSEEEEEEEVDSEVDYEKRKLEKRKLENDEFFDAKPEKKTKLPALQGGYFSGGESDSDIDNDKVVKAATSKRKNRRGQRERQKIWELKYGSRANHVQKEKQRVQSEREKRQAEYEERVKKRAEKLKLLIDLGGTGSNQTPLSKFRTHKPGQVKPPPPPKEERPLHPSWEAKINAQNLAKQKFAGKKVVFD